MDFIQKKIKEKNHRIKIMIQFSFLLAVVTAVLYLFVYNYFINRYSDLVCTMQIDVLEQKSNNLIYLTENIKNLSNATRLNNAIMRLSYEEAKDIYELLDSQRQLDGVRVSSELIHSIYLFNRKTGDIYVSMDQGDRQYQKNNFFDKDIYSLLNCIKAYGSYAPIARKITLSNGKSVDVLTYIMYDYFSATETIDGVIVINVPLSWVGKKIDVGNYTVESGKKLMLLDNEGSVKFSSDMTQFLEDKSQEDYVKYIVTISDDKGYFITQVDGVDCLLTYEKNSYADWIFIGITPYSIILEQLRPIQFFSVVISLSIFGMGLFLLWIISKRIANNFQKMEQQVDSLKIKNQLHAVARRNEFIASLLKGNITANLSEICEKFEEYQLRTDPSGSYFLAILEIDRFQAFCKSCNLDERNVKMKELLEIIDQIVSKEYLCDIGLLSEHQMIVLCNLSEFSDISQVHEKLTLLLSGIQQEAATLLFSISIAVSEVGHTYRELSYMYEETVNHLEYRYLSGHKSIIFPFMLPDQKMEISINELKKLENSMTSAISKMKKEEMGMALEEYIKKLTMLSPYEIKMIIMNFLMQVKSTILDDTMVFDMDEFNMQDLISDIANAETLEETHKIINYIFQELIELLLERKQEKYNSLIEDIKAYIQGNYASESISINAIADNVNLSIAYLGRIFKSSEGISIADYIIQVRLNCAKELLLNTNISVNEIAGQLGFTNSSYFYYVFKRNYNMTPNQFRLMQNEKE